MKISELGVVGYDDYDAPLMAALVTGDPVALVGSHGSAKTLFCRRLACAMGLKFHAYDASKALFDDVIGFPNPSRLAQGVLDYVRDGMTIWDKEFVLIDEISRADPTMQNKWLEVIRARSIMGRKVECLKYVFAAMNPTDYIGAMPLDLALAARFTWIIETPKVGDMSEDNIRRVIRTIGDEDAPMLGVSDDTAKSSRLFEKIISIRGRTKQILDSDTKLVQMIENLIHSIAVLSKNKNIKIADGRRLSMIRRNLTACLVADGIPSNCEDLDILSQKAAKYLPMLFPAKLLDEDRLEDNLNAVLSEAIYATFNTDGLIPGGSFELGLPMVGAFLEREFDPFALELALEALEREFTSEVVSAESRLKIAMLTKKIIAKVNEADMELDAEIWKRVWAVYLVASGSSALNVVTMKLNAVPSEKWLSCGAILQEESFSGKIRQKIEELERT